MSESQNISSIVLNRMGNAIVATVQVDLTPSVMDRFKSHLLEKIRTDFAPYLILDLSGLEMMDLDEFNQLKKLTVMASLMGVTSIYSSLQPTVVTTLVQLNADIDELQTALNLDEAFEMIQMK